MMKLTKKQKQRAAIVKAKAMIAAKFAILIDCKQKMSDVRDTMRQELEDMNEIMETLDDGCERFEDGMRLLESAVEEFSSRN